MISESLSVLGKSIQLSCVLLIARPTREMLDGPIRIGAADRAACHCYTHTLYLIATAPNNDSEIMHQAVQ